MERSTWTIITLMALGAGALVLALAPSSWPNPMAGIPKAARSEQIGHLEDAAAAVDRACEAGSSTAFAKATTASYRKGLSRRLDAVEATLSGQTLRAMAAGAPGYQQWFTRPVWALEAAQDHAAVAVGRADGKGAQVLVFRWDGERFLLDHVRHAPRVTDQRAAQALVHELLQARQS